LSTPRATTGTAPGAPQVARPSSLPQRAFRTALLVVTVAVACYVAFGFGRWWALSRNAAPPIATDSSDAADLGPLAPTLPLGGQWAFDELDWNLKTELVASSVLDAQLAQLGKSPLSKLDPQLPDTDPEIMDLISTLQIQPIERSGDEVYRIDRSDLRAELITRNVAEQSKTVAFAIAYSQTGDMWQLYVFTPKQSATDEGPSAAPHLLPLPAGARRSGGRFDKDGRVLLELLSLDSTADSLLADWKKAGWEVRPSGIADPANFSYLCARGDEVIYAWSADPPASLKNLMLVHTPAPADTGP
jgi:hypothetical protein